jgi:16S rRNA (cytosine967-C5)-methyltransferase
VLGDLKGRCDLVLIDAPCTGSGAWRRNPDAKWRIRPGALEQRIKEQDETLESALGFVKRG